MGAPGIGKSAFAAHLAHEYGRGTVIAVQFCDWKKPDHRDACRIIRTLAFQIATRLPDYRKLLLTLPIMTELDRKNSAELFDGLLTNPLKLSITGGRERYLIVIDALDEAGSECPRRDGRNELVEVLARYAGQLPDWIGLVVTSRPEFDVTTPFQALKPFPFETKSAANSDDIRAYLRRELAAQLQNRPDADRLVEQILEKSEGVFLYVESFCEDIRKNHLSLDRPNEFPQGLAGKFYMDFQRYFPDLEKFRKDVRPALRAILAAREPLPVEILQRLFNWQDEELRDFTRPLASLFPVTTETGHKVIKPYHKSLADWLADEAKAGAYFVSVIEGHRMLGQYCWQEFRAGLHTASKYARYHARSHFMEVPSIASEILDETQMKSLLQNEATLNPLLLFTALEALGWCSSSEQRTQRISELPCTTEDPFLPTPIFRQILKWLAEDFDATIVKELLTNLACSRIGLSEHELLDLIKGESVKVIQLLKQLRPLLQTHGSLVFFFHVTFYETVCEEYFKMENGLRLVTHRRLFNYFSTQVPSDRSLSEIEWRQAQLTKYALPK